jgi:hypothetical protein
MNDGGLTTVTYASAILSDRENMLPVGRSPSEIAPAENLPDLLLRAISFDDHQATLRMLSLVMTPCGGWLLRHRRPSPGTLQVAFQFERSAALDIYVMLIAVGLDLTSDSHLLLTSYCQRPETSSDDFRVVSCELEIRELTDEASSPEPLFVATANA